MSLETKYLAEWYLRTEDDLIRLIKCKKNTECRFCEKPIGRGSYCFGRRYVKTCLDCFGKILPEIREKIKLISKNFDDIELDLKVNQGTYLKNNVVSALNNGD